MPKVYDDKGKQVGEYTYKPKGRMMAINKAIKTKGSIQCSKNPKRIGYKKYKRMKSLH